MICVWSIKKFVEWMHEPKVNQKTDWQNAGSKNAGRQAATVVAVAAVYRCEAKNQQKMWVK
jgi:hypothetical protein